MSYSYGHGDGDESSAQAQPAQHGEKLLWRAVVDRAMADACGCVTNEKPVMRERMIEGAVAWFERGGIDMRLVCDLADVDPQALAHRAAIEIRAAALSTATGLKCKNSNGGRHVRRPKKRRTEPD